jgi:hypothetical protein
MATDSKTANTSIAASEYRTMRALPNLRYVEMGQGVRVLEQAWAPADGYGGLIEWRPVPVVSREEAGYE